MSEYWVSKKKYFCKYCETYIADDVPSRQHHENGLRHKGNVERFIRGIYKAGEKQKKDREEEKREMKRVEQAAAAAFAQDIGSGVAKPSSSSASLSVSKLATKPLPKPSSPYANYTTAASLGYSDPDADRLAEETKLRQTQGIAGDWEVVTTTAQHSTPSSSSSMAQQSDTAAGTIPTSDSGGAEIRVKREAGPPDDEDIRAFKLRRKQLIAGLGQIYDPGLIPIKVKKKEEPEALLSFTVENIAEPQMEGSSASKPNRTIIQLSKIPTHDSINNGAVTKVEEDTKLSETTTSNPSSKWAKAQWSEPIPDIPLADRTSMFGPKLLEPDVGVDQTPRAGKVEVKSEEPGVKVEEHRDSLRDTVLNDDGDVGGIKFKKRRAPINAGRGRREF